LLRSRRRSFFNTIIDDLFAFIVKMPTMARIAVFRDDVVFIVYMCQRLSYPVDKTRPAEGFEGPDEPEANGAAAVPEVNAPGGGGSIGGVGGVGGAGSEGSGKGRGALAASDPWTRLS
jgi:hypothetical protein